MWQSASCSRVLDDLSPLTLTIGKYRQYHLQNTAHTWAFSLSQAPPRPRSNLPSSDAQHILFYYCCTNDHKLSSLTQHKSAYRNSASVSLAYNQNVSGLVPLYSIEKNLFAWLFLLPASWPVLSLTPASWVMSPTTPL